MQLLKAIFALLIQIVNSLKAILPIGKVVVIADRNNWISINYNILLFRQLFSRHLVTRVSFVPSENPYMVTVDVDFKNADHKGINLYRVSEYNICVELEIFPSEISFEKKPHRDVIAKWFSISAECINFFEKIVLQKQPYTILISQGHNYDAAIVRALACLHSFRVLAVENTFNKNKIIWEDVSGITVNKNLAKNYYWKYRDFVSSAVAERYVAAYLENIKQVKAQEHQTPLDAFLKSSKKTVLFIGQVYTDSSVLFGINGFSSPVAVIEQLVDYCLINNYHLVIKLHPKESTGDDIHSRPYNNLTYRKISEQDGLLEKILSAGFVLDANRYDTYALIDSADACVTINSQAGLEALIKGKDVIVCGQGYYTGLGFTLDALNNKCLINFLDMLLKEDISVLRKDEIDKFFYIVSEKYFVTRTIGSVKALLLKKF